MTMNNADSNALMAVPHVPSSSGKNGVDARSTESEWMSAIAKLTNALMGGTSSMRAMGKAYLPKWPNEEDAAYKERLSQSTLFPAFQRTVKTLSARPFSKPITLGDDVPEQIKELCKDFDLHGNSIDVVVYDVFVNAMANGLCGIMVDHPRRPEGADTTVAADKALNMRPYAVRVYQEQILGWRTAVINGRTTLSQLRLMECVEEPDGEFGTKKVHQVRVLEPGRVRLYRKAESSGVWLLTDDFATTTKVVPFVPFYGERRAFMVGCSPLLELAHLNVKHWQQQSDQDNLMHVARVPILTSRCVGDTFELTVGGGAAVDLKDNPAAELRFVEHSGAAIGAGKTQLDDLKEEMRQSGAELLVLRPGPATATEVASDNAVGQCALQQMTEEAEDAIDQVLQIFADYLGQEAGGHATMFKDFGAATLAEASAQLLVSVKNAGVISGETLFEELQRRGILRSELTWEDEKQRVEEDGPTLGSLLPPTPGLPGAPKPAPGAPAPAPGGKPQPGAPKPQGGPKIARTPPLKAA